MKNHDYYETLMFFILIFFVSLAGADSGNMNSTDQYGYGQKNVAEVQNQGHLPFF